ncbi:spore germination protein GerPC [Neobacillus sp. LXY-4]|uniref:spore germination protein GerPC n=1 Tax=Neobacillus sp. LXY-4 TaxID=3379826 RepID=UPI003EE15177
MYHDFQYYLGELHANMMRQEQRIQTLEKLVSQLTTELDELKKKPPINVEKIEYKFDQLKVETLDGTLNIGLNPSDLQGIDSLEVNNSGAGPHVDPVDPKGIFRNTMEIEEEVFAHLETDLPQLINNAEARVNQKLDDQYLDFIKEDIKMQVPSRVQHHLQQTPFQGSDHDREGWKQSIIQKLLKEMENGICTFITNMPNHMKGMKGE